MPRADRHVPNPYIDAAILPTLDPNSLRAQALALVPPLLECAQRGQMPRSTGDWRRDQSVYVGLGGVALALLRVGLSTPDGASHIDCAREICERCIAADEHSNVSAHLRPVSFYCGTPGALAILAVACHARGDADACATACARLLDWQARALDHKEDELLFGRAARTRESNRQARPLRAARARVR